MKKDKFFFDKMIKVYVKWNNQQKKLQSYVK